MDLSAFPDPDEDVHIHVEQGDEGQDACSEGGVPGQGESVPEYKCWILPRNQKHLMDLVDCGSEHSSQVSRFE